MNSANFEKGSIGIKIRRWQDVQTLEGQPSRDCRPCFTNNSSSVSMDITENRNVEDPVSEEMQFISGKATEGNHSMEPQNNAHLPANENDKDHSALSIAGTHAFWVK